jgi:hypothetical protein
MNNEPVAWMHKEATSWVSTFIHPETEPDEWLPLYTHPAKEQDESFDRTASHMVGEYVSYPAKTLTDEEILEIVRLGLDEFRAILKKAQEK